MYIYLDNSLIEKLCNTTIDGKSALILDDINIVVATKEFHLELAEESKYPAITILRIDKRFDVSRFSNEVVEEFYNKEDPDESDEPNVVDIYESPRPYNITYQVELLAKNRYHIDLLESYLDKCINARGDVIVVKFKDNFSDVDFKTVSYDIDTTDYARLDEEENNVIIYRRIYTFIIKTLIDFNVLLSDGVYIIKNEIEFKEENF